MDRYKKYTAPLPFQGQKRNFVKLFAQELAQISDFGKGWTIVDVFGGSGLLARTAKDVLPESRVIYNDFDGYAHRLKRIDETNQIREKLFNLVQLMPNFSAVFAVLIINLFINFMQAVFSIFFSEKITTS